ncbi:proline--tRNA ligase [Haliangium ochraceum]|uniref:Proline--tRNA ligase n=1 Tax=Haliangium ochraceum (strain DSM 14365 / JCM 11303 / SMP-2) TaxID=502025 RepID=D0LZ99_HALO1|nr:proline--tRNA ligase [Haliangium ochraceum]ACY16361.1 prolyl-tRNA synthetase [Haliangium ochraceum DSM 14365]
MRLSWAFIPTLKESPADAQVVSHVYMVRGGYMRRLAAGVYTFLPLGWRVIRKIENIVREEMDAAGAQEVLMPAAIPGELWQESGRWSKYGPELLRFQDRKGADFCFGPTHEEVVVDMVRRDTKSYRELPLTLYQIQSKFRDELRPRAGLMRGREFIMKDAYSFDVSEEAAMHSYTGMYQAYERIFRRCGLDFRPVEADTGAIGGSRSHEFQVLAESGEDAIVSCDACEYAANVEEAKVPAPSEPGIVHQGEGEATLSKVATPGTKTIEQVTKFLGVEAEQVIKTLVYMADDKPLLALVRGDRSLNEIALKKATGATQLFLAREGQVKEALGTVPGFAGPVCVDAGLPIYADDELRGATGAVCGANELDAHYTGVDLGRDLTAEPRFLQLRMAVAGDRCPRCDSGRLRAHRGIEVGHVFYLGTTYSAPMGCTFLDEAGQETAMEMGCYGIGITRIAAAAIEQNHDEGGIVWPLSIAPYEVAILPLQMKDEDVAAAGETLYAKLKECGIEVLLDDRAERPGAKFKDADLIGIPLRVAIGKRSLDDGKVEVKWRKGGDAELVPVADAVEHVAGLIRAERERLGQDGA